MLLLPPWLRSGFGTWHSSSHSINTLLFLGKWPQIQPSYEFLHICPHTPSGKFDCRENKKHSWTHWNLLGHSVCASSSWVTGPSPCRGCEPFCLCAPPAPLHIFSFFYCLCLLSPLSSVIVRKEYCELSQQNENQAEKLKHDWIEKFSYRVWSGNWAM